VTGGRAPSFHDLSMGEAAAPSLSRGMRRGQNSPVDKSSEKTSPGAFGTKEKPACPRYDRSWRAVEVFFGLGMSGPGGFSDICQCFGLLAHGRINHPAIIEKVRVVRLESQGGIKIL
jgi:hypothetical protein